MNHRRESHPRGGRETDADSGVGVSATERRFAYSLLEKLLEYLDKASVNMQMTRPSTRFSRRHSYSTATEDVKFFGKACAFFIISLILCITRTFNLIYNFFLTKDDIHIFTMHFYTITENCYFTFQHALNFPLWKIAVSVT